MNADGSDAQRLTYSPGRDAHPMYFPDGSRIAFQSPRDSTDPLEVDLYTRRQGPIAARDRSVPASSLLMNASKNHLPIDEGCIDGAGNVSKIDEGCID